MKELPNNLFDKYVGFKTIDTDTIKGFVNERVSIKCQIIDDIVISIVIEDLHNEEKTQSIICREKDFIYHLTNILNHNFSKKGERMSIFETYE